MSVFALILPSFILLIQMWNGLDEMCHKTRLNMFTCTKIKYYPMRALKNYNIVCVGTNIMHNLNEILYEANVKIQWTLVLSHHHHHCNPSLIS